MKIGILCGVARSAQSKALDYYDAIQAVGHHPLIFSRGPLHRDVPNTFVAAAVPDLVALAKGRDIDFFIGCTDALGDAVSALNTELGHECIPLESTHKSNLGRLSDKLQDIPTWSELNEVPDGLPIIIKPANGSGSLGGDPWAYQRYDSIGHFRDYLRKELADGEHRFEWAQNHTGVLGRYVFQEFIENEGFMYHHYMNDGIAQHWMTTFCRAHANANAPTHNTITNVDEFDFARHFPRGTFGSFQAFPAEPLPRVFDFNVRAGAFWTTLHRYICPNFFLAYFDNLLNNADQKYDWQCNEFIIDPTATSGLIIKIEDFPFSGVHAPHGLILK
jgi:hypothetical protein